MGMLAVALTFAVQMLMALAEVQALSDEFRRRRRRLAVRESCPFSELLTLRQVFVLITCFILLIGVIVALAQVSPTVSSNPDVYYGLQFLNLFIEVSAIASIYATFVFILQSVRLFVVFFFLPRHHLHLVNCRFGRGNG